jgi:hypothetical protein
VSTTALAQNAHADIDKWDADLTRRAVRLPPIDIAAKFGEQPDVDEVDVHVRSVMQSAPTRLAHRRRFPVLG